MKLELSRKIEARNFAMHVLMPEGLIRAECERMGVVTSEGVGVDCIRNLADKFKVEPEIMAMRLMELELRKA